MAIEDGDLGTFNADGTAIGGNSGGGDLNGMGLSADEAAMFQQMQDADRGPPAPEVVDPPAPAAGDNNPPADMSIDQLFGRDREPVDPKAAVADPAKPGAGDPPADDDELPPLNATQQTVSYGKYRRDLEKFANKVKALKAGTADADTLRGTHATLQADHNKLMGRFELLMEAVNGAKPASAPAKVADPAVDDPMPDVKENPFDALEWLVRDNARLKQQLSQQGKDTQQVAQAHTAESEERQLASDYAADAQAFSQTEPTFPLAYQHLKFSRFAEMCMARFFKPLVADGKYNVTQEEMNALTGAFRAEEKGIAMAALKQKKSPAAIVMEFAKMRGFDVAAAREKIKAAGAPPPAAAVPAVPAKPSVSQAVKDIREGVQASQSLSDGGAAPDGQRLTVNHVARMTDEEFGELYDRLGGKAGVDRELLGSPN